MCLALALTACSGGHGNGPDDASLVDAHAAVDVRASDAHLADATPDTPLPRDAATLGDAFATLDVAVALDAELTLDAPLTADATVTIDAPPVPDAAATGDAGEVCTVGTCQPIVLKSGFAPASLHLAGNFVYVLDTVHNTPWELSKDGQSSRPGAGLDEPVGITVGGGYLYDVNSEGDVDRLTIADFTTTKRLYTHTDILQDGQEIVLTGSNLYWTVTYSGQLASVAIDGTGAHTVFDHGINSQPWSLATDGTRLYTTDHDTGDPDVVWSVTLAGTDYRAYQTVNGGRSPDDPRGIAVDAAHVCWTDLYASNVWCAAQDGSSVPVAVATGRVRPWGIALDGANVYWVDHGIANGDGEVLRAPVSGAGPVDVLAVDQDNPQSIGIDETAVYWTDLGDNGFNGSVEKIAK